MDLSIAAAVEADHDELFDLYALVVEEGGAFPRAPRRPGDLPGGVDRWQDRRLRRSLAGALAGSYHLRADGLAAHIARGLHGRARLQGVAVGTALVEHSLAEARRLGFDAMMFNLVMESNPSRRLYERLGFEPWDRVRMPSAGRTRSSTGAGCRAPRKPHHVSLRFVPHARVPSPLHRSDT